MNAVIQKADDVAVIWPDGLIDRSTGTIMESAVSKAIDSQAKAIAISFEHVPALPSEGIRLLVALSDQVGAAKISFHITDLPPEINYTLKITNLLDFLNYVDSLDAVLKQYDTTRNKLVEFKAPPKPAPAEKDPAPANKRPQGSVFDGPVENRSTPATLTQEEARDLIQKYIPGRTAASILQLFIVRRKSVNDVKSMSQATGENVKAISKAAAILAAKGVLKSMGKDIYNYAPPESLDAKLQAFMRKWNNPRERRTLLPILLSAER